MISSSRAGLCPFKSFTLWVEPEPRLPPRGNVQRDDGSGLLGFLLR